MHSISQSDGRNKNGKLLTVVSQLLPVVCIKLLNDSRTRALMSLVCVTIPLCDSPLAPVRIILLKYHVPTLPPYLLTSLPPYLLTFWDAVRQRAPARRYLFPSSKHASFCVPCSMFHGQFAKPRIHQTCFLYLLEQLRYVEICYVGNTFSMVMLGLEPLT